MLVSGVVEAHATVFDKDPRGQNVSWLSVGQNLTKTLEVETSHGYLSLAT